MLSGGVGQQGLIVLLRDPDRGQQQRQKFDHSKGS